MFQLFVGAHRKRFEVNKNQLIHLMCLWQLLPIKGLNKNSDKTLVFYKEELQKSCSLWELLEAIDDIYLPNL